MNDVTLNNLDQVQVALRFGLLCLAGVAIFWSVEDFSGYLKARRRNEPVSTPLFVMLGAMGVATFFFAPAFLNKSLSMRWSEYTLQYLKIFAMFMTMLFFIGMSWSRLRYYGTSNRTAILKTVPIVLATLMLIGVGAYLDVAVR